MTSVDCHQHVWPAALLEGLRRRSAPPRLDGWRLELPGEPAYDVVPADHDLGARAALDRSDGVDLALLAPSSPLGVELLPPEEAHPLLAAWHRLADDLGAAHRLWAAASLVEPDLAGLADTLRHPAVCGLQVPAPALGTPAALEAVAPLLAVAEAVDVPVLVHPGPAPPDHSGPVPSWWPALTAYPAQQAEAWYAWHVAGRALLPRLRICFVALAGLAPLHHERLTQRGGALGALDPDVFYETSSYGPQAVDALTRVVGVDALVAGSDRPYATSTDAGLGDAFARALRVTNPARLLHGTPSPVPPGDPR